MPIFESRKRVTFSVIYFCIQRISHAIIMPLTARASCIFTNFVTRGQPPGTLIDLKKLDWLINAIRISKLYYSKKKSFIMLLMSSLMPFHRFRQIEMQK